MLNIGMVLVAITASHELDDICMDVKLVVSKYGSPRGGADSDSTLIGLE